MSTQQTIIEVLKNGQATLGQLRQKVFDAAGYAASSQLEPALYRLMLEGKAEVDCGVYRVVAA